jgi:hypothetical protein
MRHNILIYSTEVGQASYTLVFRQGLDKPVARCCTFVKIIKHLN